MTLENSIGTSESKEKYPKFRAFIYSLLVLIGLIILTNIIVSMNEKPEVKQRAFNTLAVMGTRAYQDDVRLTVETQGEVRPQVEIDLVPEVGGKIVYVSPNFIEGGFFEKGETLIRVDDSDFQVTKIRAQAAIAQAEQTLAREIAEGEIAKRDFEELGQGEASDLALRIPQRQQAEAALQAAKADLRAAELQLRRTRVKAPFSGRVRTKTSDIGQFVTPGSRLGRIFSTSIVEVRLPLTDADLSKVNLPIAFNAESREDAPKVNLRAVIAGDVQNWTGYIMRTDSSYNTQTRALFAIVEVFDPYGDGASQNNVPLAPGLFVDAVVEGRLIEDAIVVARDGLRPQNEVFVVDDEGNAEVKTAIVADSDATRAVITSGISAGELVIVSPVERSRIAMPMKVLDVNDPKTVIVDPPEPEWAKKAREAREKKANEKKGKKKGGFFGRKKKDDTEDKEKKDSDESEDEDAKSESNTSGDSE